MIEGEINKVGGSKKTLIASVVVVVIVVASTGWLLWNGGGGNETSISVDLLWDSVEADDAWHITVVDIQGSEKYAKNLSIHNVEIQIFNSTTHGQIENVYLLQLVNGSEVHGMQWIDQDADGYIEIGDYLSINKSYGVEGNIDLTERYLYFGPNGIIIYHPSGRIHIPPADFLNMIVEDTETGWNVTVTYVNEMIPTSFLEDFNISFRLENSSGEFFTTRDKQYSVLEYYAYRLIFINDIWGEHDRLDYNDMGFYNITWYDNDMNEGLSVNDTFIIDNYSDLIESGFKFRLICDKYGSAHTIYEVIFE